MDVLYMYFAETLYLHVRNGFRNSHVALNASIQNCDTMQRYPSTVDSHYTMCCRNKTKHDVIDAVLDFLTSQEADFNNINREIRAYRLVSCISRRATVHVPRMGMVFTSAL